MTLPILLSVPHAGLGVPEEVRSYCILTPRQIEKDGDEGAATIYDLSDRVAALVRTDVARAVVDMNRAEHDRRADGVVKTHTCWEEPVYAPSLPEDLVGPLLQRYYRPYHAKLEQAFTAGIRLAVDCHTMAAVGPPIAADSGKPRPTVCLGDGHGKTLPDGWIRRLADCFAEQFDGDVTVNQPFSGGYITRTHGQRNPWVQLELSRDETIPREEKRERVLSALARFCDEVV